MTKKVLKLNQRYFNSNI